MGSGGKDALEHYDVEQSRLTSSKANAVKRNGIGNEKDAEGKGIFRNSNYHKAVDEARMVAVGAKPSMYHQSFETKYGLVGMLP